MLKICLALACLTSPVIAQTPRIVEVKNCSTTFINRITFSTERAGVLSVVPEEGDFVKEGDIVVKLKDNVPQAVLAVNQKRAQSEIEIQAAIKAADAAKLEHDAKVAANRVSGPNAQAYPATEISRLRLNAEAAELQADQARFEKILAELTRDQAQAELESYWVIAKIGGVVTRVFKHAGEGVQQGEQIVQVVNTDRLRVEGNVNVAEYDIAKGMKVKAIFSVPGPDGKVIEKEFTGVLGYVDVSIAELSKEYRVWAEIDNSEGLLKEGLPVSMTILPETTFPPLTTE